MNENVLMAKIAQVSPESHAYIMASASELRSSPFRDETTDEVRGIFQKTAGFFGAAGVGGGGFGSHMGNAAMGVAGTAIQGVALGLAGDAVDAIRRGITKSRDYKQMLRENPDLSGHPLGAKAVQGIFSTLHRFNPQFARDPYVAGTFVRNHLESAGADKKQIDLGTLANMISARKNLIEAESKQMPLMQKQWETPLDRQRKQLEIQRIDGQMRNLDPKQLTRLQQQIDQDNDLHPGRKDQLKQQIMLLGQQTSEQGQKNREVDARTSILKERENIFGAREKLQDNVIRRRQAKGQMDLQEAQKQLAQSQHGINMGLIPKP